MRIGVIGTGRIGVMHARNLATLTDVEEVLLHDAVPEAATRAADQLGPDVRAAGTATELLAACDGVVVATTTATHPRVLRDTVAAGVPTLCEKPIASDPATMLDLVELVESAGATVLVGFHRRFDPDLVELRRRIDAGEVGRLLVVRATGFDAVPPDPSYVPTSGGIFRDLAIHDLDALPWLVNEPVVEVQAQGSVLVDDMFARAGDVDVAAATLTFASGTIAQLVVTRFDPLGYDHRVEVLGTHDSVAVGLGDARAPLAHLDGGRRQAPAAPYPGFPERFEPAYRAEVRAFCDVIAGRAPNPSPVRDSLVSLELAEACEQSRRTGSPVRLPQPTIV